MKFAIDDKIPYIRGVLEPFADVEYIPGSEISRINLLNVDGLIIRTRTRCDRHLLEGTPVKFIATATIGFDHIDTEYCQKAGIQWTNAPGCNAESVNQYIASALSHWSVIRNIPLANQTIGIIGVGNVGSKVARTAKILGLKVLLNDPPRARKEGPKGFVKLEQILEKADIISLHVPLYQGGIDKTYHLADNEFINKWKNPSLFINTCRGEVMDTSAVKKKLVDGKIKDCIIDCWENEPEIDAGLLDKCLIGTPHIAGYSRDGKANGTAQCVQAISRQFNLGPESWYPGEIEQPHFPNILLYGDSMDQERVIYSAIQSTYAIQHDDEALRSTPDSFEKLRGDYPVRREFKAFTIKGMNISHFAEEKLRQLGFKVKN